MSLFISTGDGVVDYRTVDLHLGRSSKVWCCRSLLGTDVAMCTTLYISTGDCVVDFRTVDLYWGWPSRVMCCRSILGAV